MPHHARCVSSFRLGIRISSGCGKVFRGASLPGRLSLLAGLRPASPGPAVLIRGDDPPDPHDRGSGWFCHWRRDDPPDPHDRGGGWFCHWRRDDPPDPPDRAWRWLCHWRGDDPWTPTIGAGVGFATGGGTAPGPPRSGLGLVLPLAAGRPPDPHDRGSGWFCHWRWDGPRTPTVPGLCCGTRLWLWPVALGRRWLAIGDLPLAGGRTPPGTPRCEGCAVTGHAAPGRELLLSQPGGWSLPLTVGRSPV